MYLEIALVASLLSNPHNPMADHEQHCLIENAVYESIGEGKKGMQYVTEVVINRTEAGYRGDKTFCDTVYSKSQFSWTLIDKDQRLEYSEEDYLEAAQVTLSVLYEEVPRLLPSNVMHYLNTRDATDMSWYDPNKVYTRYKNHAFLANVR